MIDDEKSKRALKQEYFPQKKEMNEKIALYMCGDIFPDRKSIFTLS